MLLYSVHEKVYISYKKSQLLMYIAVYLTIYTIRYVHWISTILFLFSRKRDVIKINNYVFSFQEGGFWNSQSSSKISQKIFLGNLSLFSYLFFFLQRVRDTDKYTDFLWWSSKKLQKNLKSTLYILNVYSWVSHY